MKSAFYALLFFFVVSCASSNNEESNELLGSYSCNDCVYKTIVLKENNAAVLKASELEMPATYIIEGNKVTINIETAEYVFTKQPDGTLEGQGDVAGIYTK